MLTLLDKKECVTLANESLVESPDEPTAVFTERWDTELSGGELVPVKLLKRNHRIWGEFTKDVF